MGAEHQTLSYIDVNSQHLTAESLSRELVPLTPVLPPQATSSDDEHAAEAARPTLFSELTGGLSLRRLTPRQMADVSLELYASGTIAFEEYELLAFQPELHPDYNLTIGALTGELAGPDKARDFVAQWEERLNFERRHNPQNTRLVRQSERILKLLQPLDGPAETDDDHLAA